MIGDINQLSLLQSQMEEIKTILHKTSLRNDEKIAICPIGENFDGFEVFLIKSVGYDLIVGKDLISGNEIQIKLPKNEYFRIIRNLYNWIQESTVITLKSSLQIMP